MRKAPGGWVRHGRFDEELTSTIPVAEVWEPPDVAEPNGEAEAGEEELHRTVPVASVKAGRVLGTAVCTEKLFTEERVILPQATLVLER